MFLGISPLYFIKSHSSCMGSCIKLPYSREPKKKRKQRKAELHFINVWYHSSSSKRKKLTLICVPGGAELFGNCVCLCVFPFSFECFHPNKQWERLFPHSSPKANLTVFLTLERSFSHFFCIIVLLFFLITVLVHTHCFNLSFSKQQQKIPPKTSNRKQHCVFI